MLSPLKPLLCRHDYYWSERHRSERCRRCGKRQAAEPLDIVPDRPLSGLRSADRAFVDWQGPRPQALRESFVVRPSARMLKAEAQERRDRLPDLLERLVAGISPSREEAIDAILAVIEDAHSANPVLFGPEAAGRFARLRKARTFPGC